MASVGADLQSTESGGFSGIHVGLYRKETAYWILNSGLVTAEPMPWILLVLDEVRWIFGLLPLVNKCFVRDDQPSIIDLHPTDIDSPLCFAAGIDWVCTIRALLRAGADMEFEGCGAEQR